MLARILPNNESPVDRMLRIVIGVALLTLVFIGPHSPWGWVGVVPLLTGLAGSCPLYTLLHLSTCPKPRAA
jgi:hypothetical protein